MARLVFRLRQVPDEEAAEVRALLAQHRIEFYETHAGNWGVSMPGLWVADEMQARRARALIDDHQRQLAERQRAHFDSLRQENRLPRFRERLMAQPVLTLAILAFCGFIVYVSIVPLFSLIPD